MYNEFTYYGMRLAQTGHTHSKVGNMSVRAGNRLYISKTGSMLENLAYSDIISVALDGPSPNDRYASSDLSMHRAIYHETGACAVIHTHSPYAVTESLISSEDFIVSADVEMRVVLNRVPLLDPPGESQEELRDLVSILRRNPALIIRGHGSYATGSSLEHAYFIVNCVEHACKIRYLCRLPRR